MGRAAGVQVFAEEGDRPRLPPTMFVGQPCQHGGHVLRYAKSRACVQCATARKLGRDVTEAEVIERATKPKRGNGLNSFKRGEQGETRDSRPTNVKCETCGKKVAAIVVRKHAETGSGVYCSRACDPGVCWKLLRRTDRERPVARKEPCRWCGKRCWEAVGA